MILAEVPIVEIDNKNIDELWPCLVLAIRNSSFVALDTELSGLGNRRSLQAKDVEERYRSICEAAQTRSILALGVSCFKLKPDQASAKGRKTFSVQTFNILALCSDNYVVEPPSVQFLVEHGFDFNKQYSSGVRYSRGSRGEDSEIEKSDKKNRMKNMTKPYLRMLMDELVTGDATIVLHNALLDLVFLYSNLFCRSPNSLASFVTDLSQMFRGGIFDTKVVAEFKHRMQASFLEYVFKKCLKENSGSLKQDKQCLEVEFLSYPGSVEKHIARVGMKNGDYSREACLQDLCQSFANHGWCVDGLQCKRSHNVDLIIQNEIHVPTKTKKRQKKKLKARQKEEVSNCNEGVTSEEVSSKRRRSDLKNEGRTDGIDECIESQENSWGDCRTHRAGFDAFMTGFAFSFFLSKYSKEPGDLRGLPADPVVPLVLERLGSGSSVPRDFANKIYLSGKDFPLQISESTFAKPSKNSLERLNRLRDT